jgi:tetratricopeptide (TPR) repeat protein
LGKILLLLSVATLLCLPALARTKVPVESLLQDAEMSVSAGHYKTAVDFYSKALKARKNDVAIYQRRANARLLMSQPKPALSDLNRAVALAPNDQTNYQLRARAFESLANYKKEKLDLDRLLTLTPATGANYLWRAHISAELKKMNDVVADCNQAVNLGLQRQELADLYKLRAQAYKKLGKKQEASRELAKLESVQ